MMPAVVGMIFRLQITGNVCSHPTGGPNCSSEGEIHQSIANSVQSADTIAVDVLFVKYSIPWRKTDWCPSSTPVRGLGVVKVG